jgi:hypothetical protein
MVKCPSGKIINPDTLKCVNIDGRIGRRILANKCPSDKIINPDTLKCVSKTGKTGKRILASKCPSDKIINPDTLRCVKREGRIGRSLTRKSPKPKPAKPKPAKPKPAKPKPAKPKPIITPVGPGIPADFISIVEDCTQVNNWQVKNEIGSGSAAIVQLACKDDECIYALKVQEANNEFFQEIEAMQQLSSFVPKLFAAWTCEGAGFIVMEKLEVCKGSRDKLWSPIGKILKGMSKRGWLHVDTHSENVMCTASGKVVLIDLGYAIKRTSEGDEQKYPKHIMSREKFYDVPLTWKDFKIIQDYNYNTFFNPNRTIEEKDMLIKSMDNFVNLMKKLCDEGSEYACTQI